MKKKQKKETTLNRVLAMARLNAQLETISKMIDVLEKDREKILKKAEKYE